nr:reverse transcriptase domain-containing protein [Tanacetum cinerariifolium]
MLEQLAGNEYYCCLDGFSGYFQIPIDPQDQEKTTFTCPYGTFAYRRMPFGLFNALNTFQTYIMAIFHDMIEETMEVFMDDFSVYEDSFSSCISHLDKMLNRDFAGGAVLGKQKSKHFQPIHYASKTMTKAQAHYTITKNELLAVVYAFEKFRPYLVLSRTIVYTHHSALKYLLAKQDAKPRLLRWILLQEFDVIIRDKKRAKNLAAEHLARLENPIQSDPEKKEITKTFPLETLRMVTFCGDFNTSWFVNIANYHAGNLIVKDSIGRPFTKMPMTWSHDVTFSNVKSKSRNVMRCLKMQLKSVKSLTYGALTLWACSRLLEGTSTFSWQ